jgi:hypothetical protein
MPKVFPHVIPGDTLKIDSVLIPKMPTWALIPVQLVGSKIALFGLIASINIA